MLALTECKHRESILQKLSEVHAGLAAETISNRACLILRHQQEGHDTWGVRPQHYLNPLQRRIAWCTVPFCFKLLRTCLHLAKTSEPVSGQTSALWSPEWWAKEQRCTLTVVENNAGIMLGTNGHGLSLCSSLKQPTLEIVVLWETKLPISLHKHIHKSDKRMNMRSQIWVHNIRENC